MPSRRRFKERILREAGVAVGADAGSLLEDILELSTGGAVTASSLFAIVDPTGPSAATATGSDVRDYVLGIVAGVATVPESVVIGNATSDTLSLVARVASHVDPSVTGTYDLGENLTPLRWRHGWFSGTVTAGTLAGTLSTSTQNSVTTMTALTTIGTLVAGAVPASLVTAGTFGAGNYVVNGNFGVGTDTGTGQRNFTVNAAAGNIRGVFIQTAGINRFAFLVDGGTESGSDAGSGIQFNAYTDAGVVSGLFSVARAAGSTVLWTRPLRVTSTAGNQLRLAYDATNYLEVSVANTGHATVTTNDTANDFLTFSMPIGVDGSTASSTTGLHTRASTTAKSSIRIPHGSAPTSPVDGDMWTTAAGLYVRINGATVGPLS